MAMHVSEYLYVYMMAVAVYLKTNSTLTRDEVKNKFVAFDRFTTLKRVCTDTVEVINLAEMSSHLVDPIYLISLSHCAVVSAVRISDFVLLL